MAEIILLCGKICSGKSTYAKKIAAKEHAVILSCDEITLKLFDDYKGDFDALTLKVRSFLMNKALEIAAAGVNPLLDFGFWSSQDRKSASLFFKEHGFSVKWHYIDTPDDIWNKNIAKRNQAAADGAVSAYIVDKGLRDKCLSRFEIPDPSEIDVWYKNKY